MQELLNKVEIPSITITTHGQESNLFEPTAARCTSTIPCCCCSGG
ncbi:hypothetical protein [Crossiella cryophila]|uniref:Ribosomally synthesized peptide (Plantazolicin-class) n=1 Tax=Crossiella cryophila TaxID=43355 RepID=A0A7W7CGK2_9PSEU|nr:hypothetical protein [Crossiella cryophila]MBB4680831.1 ribosomally synthesized peptide (plantazolicin-class) [Crossiella cryophila]